MGKPKLIKGHSVTMHAPMSLPYGERHLWEATISWEGELPNLNTAKVRVPRGGFTLFSDSLVRWEQASAVIGEATKVCFGEPE